MSGAHYSTYHSESHFTQADSFIPKRWLDSRDKRFESDSRTAVQPFSLGPRNCLGRKCVLILDIFGNRANRVHSLAYAEMRLIVTKVFWSFEMTMDESSVTWNIQKSYNIWERKPLMVDLSLA